MSLHYSYKKSYRGLGNSCTHSSLSYIPSLNLIHIELASVHALVPGKQTPSATVMTVRVLLLLSASQPNLFWIKYRGIWIKGCIPMCTLEVCSFGILSKCLCDRCKGTQFGGTWGLCCFFAPTSTDGTHSWLQQSWTWLPHSPLSPKGCPSHQVSLIETPRLMWQ